MTTERVRATVFGEVASEYDRIRPAYAQELVDDVLAYARLDGRPAVEVGAGTGIATVDFAERGVALTAVEPDAAMARVLAQRVACYPQVTVSVSSFEDHVPTQPYGLLLSAQAWHWTEPATRWSRAAAMLTSGGALALCWHLDRPADPDLLAAILAAHEAHGTAMTYGPEPLTEAKLRTGWPYSDLAALPAFGDLSERLYQRQRMLSAADYIAYLATQSLYRMLPGDLRASLFRAVEALLPEQVVMDVDTVLYLARAAPPGSRDSRALSAS